MIDRTREDIAQDKRLERHDERLGADVDRIKVLEAQVAALRSSHEEHEKRLDELDPLTRLVELVEHIRQHFAHLRLTH